MKPGIHGFLIGALALAASLSARTAPLTVETNVLPAEWVVRHGTVPVFRYAFAPGRYKPYVKELATLDGDNLLRDAPSDHLHHHALMYAIGVNGLNFWEEAAGAGVQKPVESRVLPPVLLGDGRMEVKMSQRLHWLKPENAFLPDTTAHALLVEQRTLTLRLDEPRREVALHWRSDFEVGPATNTVTLQGANYFGLGVRFLAELDPLADHFNAGGRPDLSDNRQDVSQHPWVAVAFARPERPATLAIMGHPQNDGGDPWFFSMKTPFAYLCATQRLDQQPRRYSRGDRFTLQYLVTVLPGVAAAGALDAHRARWLGDQP